MAYNVRELSFLENQIKKAGQEILSFWPAQGTDRLKVVTKVDGSPVTQADMASNKILVGALQELWPNDMILSEEMAQDPNWWQAERIWIIDPLDGTKSFMQGRNDFSILVALSVKGIVEIGYMYFPAQGVFAKAQRGQGGSINGAPLSVSEGKVIRDQGLYIRNFTPAVAVQQFEGFMDSGFAFLALGKGDLDGIIIKMTTHREWDIAAPLVLIEEGGGMVSDEKGNPIRFNCSKLVSKYVIASNGIVHNQLLRIVTEAEGSQ